METARLNSYIKKANKHLMYREFAECLLECQTGIKMAESSVHPAISELRSALCVLAVQAYAELSRGKEAVTFVSSVYNGIHESPAIVVELCILLHACVEEYSTCSALAQVWLSSPHNTQQPEYCQVAYVYLTNVIIKQKHWHSVPSFLSSCPGLSQQQLQQLTDLARTSREQIVAAETQEAEQESKQREKNNSCKTKGTEKTIYDTPITIMSVPIRIINYLLKLLPKGLALTLKKLTVSVVITYLVITRCNISVLNYDYLAPLVVAMKQLWGSLIRQPLQILNR